MKIKRKGKTVGSDTSKPDLAHLTKAQYAITQQCGTEPPFSGEYYKHYESGVYTCVCCGDKLFGSSAKYDSGSGWPSFWGTIGEGTLRTVVDESHGMVRREIRCGKCDAHLGHVFEDGPRPSGLRFCVNSGALGFIPEP